MAVGTLSKTRTRKMVPIYVGQNCVWISAGTEVFVLSTKVFYYLFTIIVNL